MRPARVQYALLLLLGICSFTYYSACVSDTMIDVFGRRTPRRPFSSGYGLQAVSNVREEASQAGVHAGDRVIAINGRPYDGYNVLLQELKKSHAGDTLQLTVAPPNAPERTAAVQLARYYPERPGFLKLLTEEIFLSILFPLGCLLLGLWVAAARPRDKNAWFMLGMMQYFAVIFAGEQYWPGAFLAFSSVWQVSSQIAGSLCIMLFGIYFPERSRFDLRAPWLKWMVIGLLAALLPVAIVYQLGLDFSFSSIAGLAPWMPKVFQAISIVAMVAIGTYFACLGEKAGNAASPDSRRRLRLLYTGSTVGNLPLFLVVLYAILRGKDIGADVPSYLLILALSFFTIFPISLAYVIVVHRAMDLRIILRQGTKHALARTSIWFVRALISFLLAVSIFRANRHHPWTTREIVQVSLLGMLLLAFRLRFTRSLSSWIDRKFFREAYCTEQVLAELASQAQSFTEIQPLVRTVSDCISNALHVDRMAVLLRSGNTFRLQYATGIDFGADVSLADGSTTIANLDRSRSATTVYLDNPDDWLLAATDSEREALRELGAEMLLPLPGRTQLAGVLALGPKRSEEPYSRADRALLQAVALHTGLSIENSELIRSLALEAGQRERIHREIEIAREVQERFLPQSYPQIAGVDLAGAYRPAQSVGGDYYDFIELKPATPDAEGGCALGIAIGDVSGKGISAALLMASLRASLRGMTRTSNKEDMAGMVREINELVYEASASNRFATFFFARFEPQTRELTYVNAGHNAPAVLRACSNGAALPEVMRLEASGPVIGLLPEAEYTQSMLKLAPGDILLAFTDGISEAMTHDGEEWGEERLIADLAQCTTMPAGSIVQCLMEAADKFAAGAPQHDDMTVVVMKMQANGLSQGLS